MLFASGAGIVNGTGERTFSPDGQLTREELATLLCRGLVAVHYDLASQEDVSQYTDLPQVSAWARDPVTVLLRNHVIRGTSDTTFSPKETCTAEQAVVLVYRAFYDRG